MERKSSKLIAERENKIYPRKAVEVYSGETEEQTGRNYAAAVTSPELAAYRVINGAEQKSGFEVLIDAPTLMEQLRDQGAAVNRGDLAQAEAMLMNQATALQSIFARLTEKAFSVTHLPHFDSFIRVALRAQNQCRATLETLSSIKNPPMVIAKQANIAHGPQQVNNGTANAARHTRAGEKEIQQNELLREVQRGTTVDPGAARSAIFDDSEMETVAQINGAEYKGG